jgi:hypothetical protein
MRRTIKPLLASLIFTFLYIGSTSIARAEPIVITFTNPDQTVVAGSNGSFSGSLTNVSGSPVTIFGSLLTLNIVGQQQFQGTLIVMFSAEPSPFSGGPITLAPGESTGVIPIFTFQTSPLFGEPLPAIASGLYIVSFGDPFIAANQLGRTGWSVTILPNPNAADIPEPATVLLLGSSLFGVAAKVYRKHRRAP